jgi:hypothetical protein
MPTEDELVICSRDPSNPEGGDSEDDKGAISTAMWTIMDIDQNSYAGFVDGEHWATLVSCFERAEERHYQPHAVVAARRMAETANDVPNDLVMAMFEIVEAEYDEAFDRNGIIFRRSLTSGGRSTPCARSSPRGIGRRMPPSLSEISLHGSLVTAHKQTY